MFGSRCPPLHPPNGFLSAPANYAASRCHRHNLSCFLLSWCGFFNLTFIPPASCTANALDPPNTDAEVTHAIDTYTIRDLVQIQTIFDGAYRATRLPRYSIVFPPPSTSTAALADFDHRYNAIGGNITYQRKVREIGRMVRQTSGTQGCTAAAW